MRVRGIIMLVVLLLVGVFAAQNWALLNFVPEGESTRFLWMEIAIPPGIVLLGVIVAITILYLVFMGQVRTAALVEMRRTSKEMDSVRKLADEAEASRFEQLKGYLEAQMGALDDAMHLEAEVTRNTILDALATPPELPSGETDAGEPPAPASGEADAS